MIGDINRVDHPREGVQTNNRESPSEVVGGEPRTIRDKGTIQRLGSQNKQVRFQRHRHSVPRGEVF